MSEEQATPPASSTPPAGTPPAGSPPASAPTVLGSAAASEPQGQQVPAGTPPSPTPFTITKFIKPDGSFDFSDIGTLPDGDEKAFVSHTLAKYKNVDEAMKAFRHTTGLVGAKGLLPLPATATPQERESFNKRLGEVLGIPKEASSYGLKRPDNIPVEICSDEHLASISEVARKHNVTPAAMQDLMAAQIAYNAKVSGDQQQAQEQATKEAFSSLQQEWGDRCNSNLVLAARASNTLGYDANNPKYGNDPVHIRAMHKFASLVSEHSLVTGGEMSSGPGLEVQLQEHNASILGQPWGTDSNSPQFKAWTEKQVTLAKMVAEARAKGGKR